MNRTIPPLSLLEEFRANPFGQHSPELGTLVQYLRGHDTTGPWVVVLDNLGPQCRLARIPNGRWDPVEVEPSPVYPSVAAAEIVLFERRWKEAFQRQSA